MRRTLTLVVVSGLALGLAGCGSDDAPSADAEPVPEETTNAPAAAEATPAAAEQQAPKRMSITMGAPTEFAMIPEVPTVAAGKVTLDVSNEGAIEHEVVVIPTDLDSGDLPTDAEGGAVEEGAIVPHGEGHEGKEMDHAGVHFDTGKSGKVSFDLDSGQVRLGLQSAGPLRVRDARELRGAVGLEAAGGDPMSPHRGLSGVAGSSNVASPPLAKRSPRW